MVEAEKHCQSSTSVPTRPYNMQVRPWFIGVAYSAIETGDLYVLDLIVQRKAAFTAVVPDQVKGVFEVFERIRDAWAELEAEYGDGAMLNIDSPDIQPDLAEDAVFPEDPICIANARKMRAIKDADWIRSAYEIETYAPGVSLPHRTPGSDVFWTDLQ